MQNARARIIADRSFSWCKAPDLFVVVGFWGYGKKKKKKT
jgi:hypothetical protein